MSPIKPSFLAVVLGLASLSVATAQNCTQAGDKTGLTGVVVEGSTPVDVCARFDEPTLSSLREGSSRLVLVLTEFQPPAKGAGSLVVKSGEREQVLGILPQTRFERTDASSHRRFFLGRPDEKLQAKPDGSVCVTVGLRSPDGSGTARVHLETWDPSKNDVKVEAP